MSKLLSIQEAADFLNLHPETLRRWDRGGRLVAVKVGERGDRRYRYEDLLKVKAGYKQEKHKGFDILPYSPGFELSPGTLTRIASFIVRNDVVAAGFAFAEGMLTRMSHPHLKDEDLVQEARRIIKERIDSKQVSNLEEYTFEYHPSNFIEVNDPKWWTKSLKKH